MKKLLFLCFLIPFWSLAQNPMSDAMDAFYRANGGKGFSQNDYSNAEKALVRSKADTGSIKLLAPVRSVNGLFGNVVLGKAQVGLPLVPNIDATIPSNIVWNSSYRTVTDIDKANWNGYQTTKVDKDIPNTISAPHNFTGTGLTLPIDVYRNIAPIATQARMYGYPQGYNGSHTSQAFYVFDGDTKQPRYLYFSGYGALSWDEKFAIGADGSPYFYKMKTYSAPTAGINGRYKVLIADTTNLNETKKVSLADLMKSSAVQSVAGKTGAVTLAGGDITSGTLSDAILSSNVPLKNAANTFTGAQTFGTTTFGGTLNISTDNTYNLGSSSNRLASTYAVSSYATNFRTPVSGGDVVIVKNDGTQIMRLFNNGNVKVSEFTTDAGYRFAVNGGALLAGSLTPAATAGITYTANLTNPVVTASANNQVLIGQQFSPTFSAGAFTGVTSYGVDFNTNLRVGGNIALSADNTYFLGTSSARLAGVSSVIYNATLVKANATDIQFQNASSTQTARVFATGNWILGSSTTDAGYRLDIGGTTRIGGSVTPASDVSYNLGSSGARLLNVWANVLNGDFVKPTTGDLAFQSSGGLTHGRLFSSTGNWNLGPTNTDTGNKLNVEGNSRVGGDILVTGSTTLQNGLSVSGTSSVDDIEANTMYTGSLAPNGPQDLIFRNSSASQIGRWFNGSGNLRIGTSASDAGYKLYVEGTSYISGSLTANGTSFFGAAATITNSTGSSLVLNHSSGSTPVSITHSNASIPTFSITNTAATGWAGFRFTNDIGVGFQFNVGGSTSTICPGCVNFQHIKGDAVHTVLESGKKFKIDATNTNGSTYVFAVDRTGNVEAGAVKITAGGYTSISNGASTSAPAGTMVYDSGHWYGSTGSVWKQLDN